MHMVGQVTTDYGRLTGWNCLKVIPSDGYSSHPPNPAWQPAGTFQSSRDETAVRHATDLDTETRRIAEEGGTAGARFQQSLFTKSLIEEYLFVNFSSRE